MLASLLELFFDFLDSSLWSYVEYGILLLIILALVIAYFLIYLFRTLNIRKRGAYYETEKAIVPLINTCILKPYLNGIPAEEIVIPEKEIKKFIGDSKFRRRALIKILVNYITLYNGKLGSVFFRIYNELELYEDLKMKLQGRNVKHTILAIDEVDFFKVKNEEIMRIVKSFQNHDSEILRESSNYYMLQVTDGKLNRFLMNLNHPLSEWERLQYYKLITRKNHRIIPQFYTHITPGTHPSKILLCIDLCIYYYQVEVVDIIFQLLTTDDSAFNLKLLNALGRFYTPEQAAKLKDRYDDFSYAAAKVEILKALGRVGTVNDLEFLFAKFKSEEDGWVKKHAAISAFKISSSLSKKNIGANPTEVETTIINHVTNTLLKY